MRATDQQQTDTNNKRPKSHPDSVIIDKASADSFPASDAPAHTPTTALGPPTDAEPMDVPAEGRPLVPVQEHPLSSPLARSGQG